MATGKAKTIDEIDNIKEMFDVMEALEISYPDLQKLDEIKSRAKSEFGQLLSISRWTAGEVSILFIVERYFLSQIVLRMSNGNSVVVFFALSINRYEFNAWFKSPLFLYLHF